MNGVPLHILAVAARDVPAPAIAERLARRVRPITEPRIGLAHLAAVEGDPIALAGRLFSEAEAAFDPSCPQLAASGS